MSETPLTGSFLGQVETSATLPPIPKTMGRPHQSPSISSSSPNQSDAASSDQDETTDAWDEEDADYQTDLTDVDEDAEFDDGREDECTDQIWLPADRDHAPEYYIQQLDEMDDSEFTREDYGCGTTILLNRIEEQWYQ